MAAVQARDKEKGAGRRGGPSKDVASAAAREVSSKPIYSILAKMKFSYSATEVVGMSILRSSH